MNDAESTWLNGDKAGHTIKVIGVISFFLWLLAGIVGMICFTVLLKDYIWCGFLVLLGSLLSGLLSYFFLLAFGELVSNSTYVRKYLQSQQKTVSRITPQPKSNPTSISKYDNGGLDKYDFIPGLGKVIMSTSKNGGISCIGDKQVYYSATNGRIHRIGAMVVEYGSDGIVSHIGGREVVYNSSGNIEYLK